MALRLKRAVKILHTLGAVGLMGAIAANIVLAVNAPTGLAELAAMRQGMLMVCKWLLLPSLALVLLSGLIAMIVHKPYLHQGWVLMKAALGLGMFEGTLATVQSQATRAASMSAKLAEGTGDPAVMEKILSSEWGGMWTIMVLSVANVMIAIWRPKFGIPP